MYLGGVTALSSDSDHAEMPGNTTIPEAGKPAAFLLHVRMYFTVFLCYLCSLWKKELADGSNRLSPSLRDPTPAHRHRRPVTRQEQSGQSRSPVTGPPPGLPCRAGEPGGHAGGWNHSPREPSREALRGDPPPPPSLRLGVTAHRADCPRRPAQTDSQAGGCGPSPRVAGSEGRGGSDAGLLGSGPDSVTRRLHELRLNSLCLVPPTCEERAFLVTVLRTKCDDTSEEPRTPRTGEQ